MSVGLTLLESQRAHRIHPRRSPRREPTSECPNDGQDSGTDHESEQVPRMDAIQRRREVRDSERGDDAQHHTHQSSRRRCGRRWRGAGDLRRLPCRAPRWLYRRSIGSSHSDVTARDSQRARARLGAQLRDEGDARPSVPASRSRRNARALGFAGNSMRNR